MASDAPVESVVEIGDELIRKENKKKSSKYGKKIPKEKHITPLGFEMEKGQDEASLEKLVLGETSELFKKPPEALDEILIPQKNKKIRKPKPAWHDDDPTDTAKRVKRFESHHGNPEWAKLGRKRRNSSSDEEDKEILQHAGNLLSRSTAKHASLAKGKLEYKRNLNLNNDSERKGIISSIEFHPTATVGLVGDSSGDASLYEVNGRTNPKLQSIQFENFRIDCAKFATNGTEFLVGSRSHRCLYSYDMEAATSTLIPGSRQWTNCKNFTVSPDGSLIAIMGNFGHIHLITARSKELVDSLKMNGEVHAISFNLSGTRLYSHGDEGEIYIWDIKSRSCIERFRDEGCLSGVAIAVSSQYVATGCTSGIVNIYSNSASKLQLRKSIMNLVTPISGLTFNASEELLGMWSFTGENGLRMAHLPSCTVYGNFPGRHSDPVSACMPGPVNSLAFSPNGGYLAIGSKLMVGLMRLTHYGNY